MWKGGSHEHCTSHINIATNHSIIHRSSFIYTYCWGGVTGIGKEGVTTTYTPYYIYYRHYTKLTTTSILHSVVFSQSFDIHSFIFHRTSFINTYCWGGVTRTKEKQVMQTYHISILQSILLLKQHAHNNPPYTYLTFSLYWIPLLNLSFSKLTYTL